MGAWKHYNTYTNRYGHASGPQDTRPYMGRNPMGALNTMGASLLGMVILLYCWREWRQGHHTITALLGIFGVYLILAAMARWWRAEYGASGFTDFVQTYSWVARLSAAVALLWRTALNGRYRPKDDLGQLASELRTEIAEIRNGG